MATIHPPTAPTPLGAGCTWRSLLHNGCYSIIFAALRWVYWTMHSFCSCAFTAVFFYRSLPVIVRTNHHHHLFATSYRIENREGGAAPDQPPFPSIRADHCHQGAYQYSESSIRYASRCVHGTIMCFCSQHIYSFVFNPVFIHGHAHKCFWFYPTCGLAFFSLSPSPSIRAERFHEGACQQVDQWLVLLRSYPPSSIVGPKKMRSAFFTVGLNESTTFATCTYHTYTLAYRRCISIHY